jgi:hypothetical protein
MSLQHRLPDQVVRADPWTFYCAVCSETMRIKTLAPSQGGMKTRTYRYSYDASLPTSDRLAPETSMMLSKGSFHECQAASLSRLVLASILG